MAETKQASKKLWDKSAWSDAGFFLDYLRPHFKVFIPAILALALTGGMTILFIKELAALVGKGIGGANGPEWMAELNHSVWFLIGIVGAQAFIAFWRILLFAKASERALASLRELAPDCSGLVVAVGLPLWHEGSIYNTVAVIVDGTVEGFVAKQNLPHRCIIQISCLSSASVSKMAYCFTPCS